LILKTLQLQKNSPGISKHFRFAPALQLTINMIDEHGNAVETWCIGGAKPDYAAVGGPQEPVR